MSLEANLTELEEFEFLMALKLSDEISAEQEERLRELIANPELKTKYESFTDTRVFIAGGLKLSVVSTATSKLLNPGRNRAILSANRLLAIATVAAVAVVGISFLFFVRSKPSDQFQWAEQRGSCESSQNKPALIQTRNGACDLKTETIALRLLPDSDVTSIVSDSELRFEFHGRLSVDAGKQHRALVFSSGEHSVRILGTQLVLTSEKGIFRAEMLEGSAEVRTSEKAAIVSTGQAVEIADAKQKEYPLSLDRLWLLRRWSSGLKGNSNPTIVQQMVQLQEPGIFYVLRLKDGRTFTGPVNQTPTHYFVMTPDGDFEIPNDQVESIDVYP